VTPTAPAHPGDVLIMYLVGMGKTNPPLETDAPAPGANGGSLAQVVNQPTVTVGGQNAQILFAGLTPGGIGLYQIDFVVPQVSTGTAPVTVMQGTVSANPTTLPVVSP